MAAFGAAHRLHGEQVAAVMYDQKQHHGGHTASYRHDNGFLFDEGPHVSFTKNERIRALFAESVGQQFETLQTRVNNYWQGYWIKHPAQCNLYGLPADLVVDCLSGLIRAQNAEPGEIRNYADWLVASFGRRFAETFPMQYGLKYHTTPAENMSTEWVGPRLYRPALEEVLRGAISPTTPDVHYIDHFRYPSRNGFVSYLDSFRRNADLRLGHRLVRLDPGAKALHFAHGAIERYDGIVSSIPLPDLVPMIVGAPPEVVEASRRLACTTLVLVNVGINREDVGDAHWTYFYDHDVFFTRVSCPHLLSPHNVPPGAGSIQVEVYYSKKYRPLDRSADDCIEPVIRDLRRCGLIREDDEILFTNAMLVPYANIIFDLERAAALRLVHGYLDEIAVAYAGRYGDWGYLWTDESFGSGENAAQKILDKMSSDAVGVRTLEPVAVAGRESTDQ